MTARPMAEGLEPCPFCGSPYAELKQYDADPGLWWRVECQSCCAKSQGAKFPALASASWNTRSLSASERRMREALEKIAGLEIDASFLADHVIWAKGIARAALSEDEQDQARR